MFMNFKLSLLFVMSILITNTTNVFSQTKTEVVVTDISNKGLKAKMEKNASAFLTTINVAFQNQSIPVFETNSITDDAKVAILTMWEMSSFRCYETEIIEKGLKRQNGGFEVRNVPILMKNAEEDSKYQEIVFVFNEAGVIDNIYIAIEANTYSKLMNQGTDVTEIRRRQIILDFVENFKTAYNRKDLAYLKSVYSNDALIIVGRVVKVKAIDSNSLSMNNEMISYQKLTKADYISGLDKIFKNNTYINVKLENIEITRHGKLPNIYGVRMDQGWNTSKYSDVGCLLLVVDFSNDDKPIIHIRTWQPEKVSGGKLSEDEKYKLESFDIKS
jgi:ketosteroid isomerase-like protein